jgi:hypothetical protein
MIRIATAMLIFVLTLIGGWGNDSALHSAAASLSLGR